MLEKRDKLIDAFIKMLKTLNNYCILRNDEENIILGTKIVISEQKKKETTFSEYYPVANKELPVFFLLSLSTKSSKEEILFKDSDLPVLKIDLKKSMTHDELEYKLDHFVERTFLY